MVLAGAGAGRLQRTDRAAAPSRRLAADLTGARSSDGVTLWHEDAGFLSLPLHSSEATSTPPAAVRVRADRSGALP